MMRHHLRSLAILLVCSLAAHAQLPSIGEKLPTVIPPSPSVASLMKFEEIPVSNYTGTPDISIPIVSLPTASKDVTLNVALSYHPASAAGNAVAGNVGLGWNLMAGGTISRTVRGFPDDKFDGKTSGIRLSYDKYNEVLALEGNITNETEKNTFWKYMYEVEHLNKYDSQFDLYQYNFMGRSGRFYINENLEVLHLDNSTLKIKYLSTSDEFIIYDENGISYTFSVKETTQQTTLLDITYFDGSRGGGQSETPEYVNAYHLKTVRNHSGSTLLEFNYSENYEIEPVNNVNTVNSQMAGEGGELIALRLNQKCFYDGTPQLLEPKKKISSTTSTNKTKKLTSILIPSNAVIEFIHEAGRSDYNLSSPTATKVKHLVIKKPSASAAFEETKRFTLNYNYSSIPGFGDRLFLVELNEVSATQDLKYKFEYKKDNIILSYQDIDVGLDHWGFFTETPSSNRGNKEASREFCANDLLQKIILPTGGCKIIDFESNTYSYTGHDLIENFDDNPDNWQVLGGEFTWAILNNGSGYTYSNSIYINTGEVLDIYVSELIKGVEAIHLQKQNADYTWSNTGIGFNCSFTDCTSSLTLPPGNYRLYYVRFDGQLTPGEATYQIKSRVIPPHRWLYGGGVRIKRIGYFDQDVDKAYYDDETVQAQHPLPSKEVNYNYQFFNDEYQSSGALITTKPAFKYAVQRHNDTQRCINRPPDRPTGMGSMFTYEIVTSSSNTPLITTKGGSVGYKYVTVYESAKGKSLYTYSTPIDYSDPYIIGYPFQAPPSCDYKYGLLQNQKIFDSRSVLLKEIINQHEFASISVTSGINIYTSQSNSCPFQYLNYEGYMAAVADCNANPSSSFGCVYSCGAPEEFISYNRIIDYIGWAKLTSTTTKEYMPDRSGANSSFVTTEEYAYNPLNQQVSLYKRRVQGSPVSEEERKEFTYYLDPGYLQNNRISEILQVKSFKGTDLLSTQKIEYMANSPRLPQAILSSKGNEALEQKVQFLSYTSVGRPREVKQTDGMTVTYLWGNNNMGPVAMVENATILEIAQALNISVSLAMSLSEISMPMIDSLRQHLPKARVTSYTYKPLAGVETITDPRGLKSTFTYDSFGRLKYVIDFDNKVISANEYHYRTQTN